MFDFVTKPGAPTGIDDKRCAIDMAIIHGFLRRMGVTLRWGPTRLMLGDALTKDKADAADLLRACAHISSQMSNPRCKGLGRGVRPGLQQKPMVKFEVTGDDTDVPGRARRRGANRVVDNGSTGAHAGELPSQGRVVKPSTEAGEKKSDSAARGEHGQHPSHDGSIPGRQGSANAGGPGERLRKVDAGRAAHGHEEPPYSPAVRYFQEQLTDCPNTIRQFTESPEYNEAVNAVADCAARVLEHFPRERSRPLALLTSQFGWRTWSNDDEDWTRSMT